MNDIKFYILELRKKILDANYQYYELDNPIITDKEYDDLIKELQKLEKEYPEYITEDSPTQRVGGNPSTYLAKVEHLSKMYSLENVYTDKEFDEFKQYVSSKGYNPEELEWYCDVKLDGISLSLTYRDGEVYQAATRGDGLIGEDITEVVLKSIKNIPDQLKKHDKKYIGNNFQFRGECIIPLAVFYKKNAELVSLGEKTLANARNMVAGLLRRLPTNLDNVNKDIKFFCYGVWNMDVNCPYAKTHSELMDFIRKLGLPTVPYSKVVKGISEVKKYYNEILEIRNKIPMAIDGIVFRINDFRIQNDFDYTSKFPRFARAYKFPPEQACGILEKIIYQVGRTGVITPVAEFKNPVPCNGILITRATLHNEDYIREKDIRIGDTVLIERSGDVIPKIVKVIFDKRPDNLPGYDRLERCPCCGSRVHREDVFVYCTNPVCSEKLKSQFNYIASKQCLNLVGLGPRIIEDLFNKGYLKHILDIFKITKNQLTDVGIGDIRAEKLSNLIQSTKQNILLSTVVLMLGIPHVGKVTAKDLSKHFESLDKLANATYTELIKIPNIGDGTIEAILNYFEDNPNIVKDIDNLNINISLMKPIHIAQHICPLTNKNVMVTGVFDLYNRTRSEMFILLEKYGINIVTSIGKADYLLVGTNGSSKKIEEAQRRNKNIVYETELMSIINPKGE